MFTQNTLNLFGLSGIVKPDSKPIPSVRGTFEKVVAVNAGPDISAELSDLMDRYETVEGSDFSFFRETEDDPYCWGPSKKKHFGQANLKRGQVN